LDRRFFIAVNDLRDLAIAEFEIALPGISTRY